MLLRKMWRDLFQNKVQFLSIFLLSFLGIMIYVGLDSESAGLQQGEFRYYEETNLADLWVRGKKFIQEDVDTIRQIKDVNEAERRYVVDEKAELSGEPSVQMIFLEENNISKMKMVNGENYQPGEPGVFLDEKFAQKQGIAIGDSVTLKINQTSFTVVLKGTFFHPEYIYYLPDASALIPDYGSYGVAIMDVSQYPFSDSIPFNQIVADVTQVDNTGGLDKKEKEICEKVEKEIADSLDTNTLVVTDKDSSLSYQTFRAEMEQHQAMSYLFPMVFLLISLLGIITTMTRLTAKQRVQIGTLKALGFSKRKIAFHYVSYGFALSLLGGILGAVVGYSTIPGLIIQAFPTTYQLPYMYSLFSMKSFVAISLSTVISTFISFYSCRKILRLPAAETLKPTAPAKTKHSTIEKSKLWLHLHFTTQWNVRDILRNKIRSLMGMLGVAGCAMLLLCACGCLDTVNYITGWMYGELNTASYKIMMKEGTSFGETQDYANKYQGQMIEIAAVEIEQNGQSKSGSVTILGNGNFYHYQNEKKKHIFLEQNGIAMSKKIADALSLKEGDFFTFHMIGDDTYHRVRLSQIYRTPSDQGITMSREMFESLQYRFLPTEILTNHTVSKELENEDQIDGVQNMNEMMDSMESMMAMMYLMVGILIVAAAVLGIVVLYNLGVLSLVEKSKEMATLKVLGFSTPKIRWILQQQNIFITGVGILIGIPAGYAMLAELFLEMPDSMDYAISISLPSYLYTACGTFLLSYVVNRFLSRKVKTIDMIDALKGEE